jgi:hypothetical protein
MIKGERTEVTGVTARAAYGALTLVTDRDSGCGELVGAALLILTITSVLFHHIQIPLLAITLLL